MENLIRVSLAVGIFVVMATWEAIRPRRNQHIGRAKRWPINLGLALVNIIAMRLTLGSLAYLSAEWAAKNGYGLLNLWQLPDLVKIMATLLSLDFAIYAQHIAMHKSPLLWRLHKVHHTDLEFDASTALRFHPLEILLSMLYKAVCIVFIGGNPTAVLAFEIILNGAATFNHSNVNIPADLDKKLRWLLITPDMHRIHHSSKPQETDSNYGFSVSWWDRLCKTYTEQPHQGQTSMTIGLSQYRNPAELGFVQCLRLPFTSKISRMD